MSRRTGTHWSLLLWGSSAGLVSSPADVAAQVATRQAPAHLTVWIAEARSTPFHGLMVAGTPQDPAAKLAVGVGAVVPDALRPPMTPVPDSAVSGRRVFQFTLVAALVPMVPALIASAAPSHFDYFLWYAGGMALGVVLVPFAAMDAGAPSVLRAIVGTATGFWAGVFFGGVAVDRLGDFFFIPTYSVTMALATTLLAAW